MVAAVAAALALSVPTATATFRAGTVSVVLRYDMTCGEPGPGPATVRLPSGLTPLRGLTATVDGRRSAVRFSGRTVSVALPKPPQVTCMSITYGRLRLTLRPVRCTAPPGDYPLHARVRTFAFATRVHLP